MQKNDGRSPLHLACLIGHLDVAKYLVDEKQCNSACADNNGWTAVHVACQNGHLDVAKYLVDEKQCNPACADNNGWTASACSLSKWASRCS